MADARVGGRYRGRHRGRHRAPVPSVRQRIERPGAGALAALGVAAMATAAGSRPPAVASVDQASPVVAAAPLLSASLLAPGVDDRASRAALRSPLRSDPSPSAPVIPAESAAPTRASAPVVEGAMVPVPAPSAPVKAAKPAATPKPSSTTPVAPSPAPPGGVGPIDPAYAAAAARIGLRGNAIAVYSAVRTQFGITNIGGYRAGDMDHGTGHAVDVMVGSNSALGDAVAAYVLANRGAFNVKYIIWRQRIWLPELGYWRAMSDRGSITANHYDHVHISVN